MQGVWEEAAHHPFSDENGSVCSRNTRKCPKHRGDQGVRVRPVFPVKIPRSLFTGLHGKTSMKMMSIHIRLASKSKNLWRGRGMRARWGYIRGFKYVCNIFYIKKIPKQTWQNEQMVDT